MIPKPIDDILENDVAALVLAKREEGPQIDFKSWEPRPSDDKWKNDFCKDVCAFGNAAGGDLVYGMEEVDGVASKLAPFEAEVDSLSLTLQNLVLERIEPQLHGVRIRPVPCANGGFVLVVRVPRSFSGIHRLKTNKEFYVRESSSNRALDVPAIVSRISELLGHRDRVNAFFDRRYSDILAGQYPIELTDGPKLVVHAVPVRDFLDGEQVDYDGAGRQISPPFLTDIGGWNPCRVFDGRMFYASVGGTDNSARTSTLLMNSGVIEATCSLRPWNANPEQKTFLLEEVEASVLRFLAQLVSTPHIASACGIPFVVRVCLLATNGWGADSGQPAADRHAKNSARVQQNSAALVLPEVLVESADVDFAHHLHGMFSRAWQAWNYSQSPFYTKNADGRWVRNGRR
jgi:hypothetical protein